ncbi:hypothetical protein GN244_ATG09923 [Phytophthora infestans]|uniref:Uncharacterized protein n=1 Tax=Phytophthora infestans TaxID=4787 RepID=A0A833T6Z4_PHYIN|nr:hypothetical protein GN244_ATG09923 [Phytophthora infestans]KAF4137529.1 hypothetical protein GN958_ATG13276 [Phytophthora infestans]
MSTGLAPVAPDSVVPASVGRLPGVTNVCLASKRETVAFRAAVRAAARAARATAASGGRDIPAPDFGGGRDPANDAGGVAASSGGSSRLRARLDDMVRTAALPQEGDRVGDELV